MVVRGLARSTRGNSAIVHGLLAAVLLAGLALGCSEPEPQTATDAAAQAPDAQDFDGWLADFFYAPPDTAAPEEETAPEPGTFGAPCKNGDDCDTGVCVESADGKTCSRACSADCPQGYTCSEQQGRAGDTIYICIPRFKHLCDPCLDNSTCNLPGQAGNVCVPFGGVGKFCGAACDPLDPQCPPDYECGAAIDPVTGSQSHQCLRAKGAGACRCSGNAKLLGLKTSCTNKNPFGECKGERFCTTTGLTACQAPVPEPEKCDNLDNDCNGKTDDFDVTAKCEKTNEHGTCKGILTSCTNGEPECDAPKAKPEDCNGLDDDCDGKTDEGLCDDGDPCTTDTCNTDGSCKWTQIGGLPCDDGSICTQTDKCVAGKCIGGNAMNCDDNDPCTTDSCDPFKGCISTPASDAICAEDGNACTQDLCQTGKCVHPPVKDGGACADDGKACTSDICNNGLCTHPPSDGQKCEDDGIVCTADLCSAGACTHVPADGLKCQDDGKACTDDVCQSGKCAHVNGTGGCDDFDPCTEGDTCSAGKCLPGKLKNCNDSNPCTNDSCNKNVAGGCVHTNNDWASCTAPSGDCPVGQCSGGTCTSKPNMTCQTEIKVDLCGSQDVAGVCTSSGKCVATKANNGVACSIPCNGICFKCFGLQVCFPLT